MVVRLVQGRDRRRDHAVLGHLRGLPLLRRQAGDHGRGGGRAEPQRRHVSNVPRDLGNGNRVERAAVLRQPATIKTSGMDIAWNWFKPIGERQPRLQSAGDDPRLLQDEAVACTVRRRDRLGGLVGPDSLSGTNAGAYDYRLFGSVNYSRNNWNVALRLASSAVRVHCRNMRPSRRSRRTTPSVAAGGPGILLGYTPTTEYESNDYNIFDLSFGWNINDTLSFRGGITNLFDTEPESWAANGISDRHRLGERLCRVSGVPPPGCQAPLALQPARRGGGVPAAGTYQPWLLRHARPSLLHRHEHAVLSRRLLPNLSRRA